jgi:hypothetical protein
LRAIATTSRRNSSGYGFGMMKILPASTNPHRSGLNQTGGSPLRHQLNLDRIPPGSTTRLEIGDSPGLRGADLSSVPLYGPRPRSPAPALRASLQANPLEHRAKPRAGRCSPETRQNQSRPRPHPTTPSRLYMADPPIGIRPPPRRANPQPLPTRSLLHTVIYIGGIEQVRRDLACLCR